MGKIAGKYGEMTAHYQKNVNKNNDEKGKRLTTSDSKTNDSRKYRELW